MGCEFSKAQIPSKTISLTEGKLVFDINYEDSIFNKNPIKDSSFPKEIIYLLKGNDFRTEIQSDYTHSSIIGNLSSRNSEIFLEFMNKKLDLHSSLDSLNSNAYSRNPFNFNFTQENKTILGYSCKKVIVHFSNSFMKDIILYYAESIPNIPSPYTYAFYKIPGMILELDENFQGIPIKLEVRTIQKIPLDSEYFNFLKGYKPVNQDEFITKALQP